MTWYKTYRRVVGLPELLYLSGKWLKRKAVKYTTIAVILGIGAFLADTAGTHVFGYDLPVTSMHMLLAPLLTATATFGVGQLLTSVAHLLTSEKLLTADANSMNLMEDRKKADLDHYLELLWERVFCYESLVNATEEKRHQEVATMQAQRAKLRDLIGIWSPELLTRLGVDVQNEEDIEALLVHIESFRPYSTGMEATREGFIESARYALHNALPQANQMEIIGFNLSLLEDWFDGAFFTDNDCKLKQQFYGNNAIVGVRRRVGIPLSIRLLTTLLGTGNSLAFYLTMSKIGMKVGVMIDRFNHEFVPDTEPRYFDAQHFLWPDQRTSNYVCKRFGNKAVDKLRDARKQMIQDIFSADPATAGRHLFTLFGSDYINALRVRLQFDIEFAAGMLKTTPLQDLQEIIQHFGHGQKLVASTTLCMKNASRRLAEICTYVDKLSITLSPAELRAVKIAYFLNEQSLQEQIATSNKDVNGIIQAAASAHRCTSELLCSLRLHYELTRLHLISYRELIAEMGQWDRAGAA